MIPTREAVSFSTRIALAFSTAPQVECNRRSDLAARARSRGLFQQTYTQPQDVCIRGAGAATRYCGRFCQPNSQFNRAAGLRRSYGVNWAAFCESHG